VAAGMSTTDTAATMAMASLVNNLVIAEVIIVITVTCYHVDMYSNILLGSITIHTRRWVLYICSHDLLVH